MSNTTEQQPEDWQRRIQALEAQIASLQSSLLAANARSAPSGTTSTGVALEHLVQTVINIGVELVRAEFGAFFYTSTDASGEHLMLYALAGAPREAFSAYPIPGRTHLFRQTFDGEGIIRCEDVLLDPRYGRSPPHYGMPPNHLPVRSYLAAPVISATNAVLGGLFFGHPQPGIFTERAERIVAGIAQLAAIALENSALLTAVQNNERRFKALIENSSEGLAIFDANATLLYVSPAVTAIEGFTFEEIVGTNVLERMHPDDVPALKETFKRAVSQPGERFPVVHRRRHKDGQWLWLEGIMTNLLHDPAVRGIVSHFRDVTERRRTEEALIRSQKVEALGTLAGGIAHDFNNLLLAISGNTKLALEDVAADHPAAKSLSEIAKASQRAADLVGRILAFSRQQEPKREVVELRPIVEDALQLLRATLPAMIELKASYASNVPPIYAESSQIHQVIMNLVTNASHAIADRGTVEVRVDSINVAGDTTTLRDLHAGEYTRVSVSDSGCGMSTATIQRIFDPFFTTKPAGQGTGLGLSVVHGIVKSHDGGINVYSQPGKGSTFHVYLPAATERRSEMQEANPSIVRGAGERVLYIDDDSAIVFLTARILTRLGYHVTGCEQPAEALQKFRAAPHDFDVVVTDLSMPGMSGFDIARELRSIRADIPVLMTSGYVRPEDRETAHARGIRDLILKPNTVDELGRSLDRVFTELRNERGR